MHQPPLPAELEEFIREIRSNPGLSQTWVPLYRSGAYKDALLQVESELETDSPELDNRLGWILLQLELEQVPIKTLVTPVTEILPELNGNGNQVATALAAVIILADKLAARSLTRLGVGLVRELLRLSAHSAALSPSELQALNFYCCNYLKEELSRAESKKENKEHLSSLKEEIGKLEKQAKELQSQTKQSSAEAKRPESKQAKRQSFDIDSRYILESTDSPSMEQQSLALAPLETGKKQPGRISGGKPLIYTLAGLLLFFFLYVLIEGQLPKLSAVLSLGDSEPRLQTALLPDFTPRAELSLPNAIPSTHEKLTQKIENLDGNIGAVGARLNALKTENTNPLQENSDSGGANAGATANNTPSEIQQAKGRAEDEVEPFGQQKPSTPALTERATNKVSSDSRKLPRLESKTLGTLVIENIDREPPVPAIVNAPSSPYARDQKRNQQRFDSITPQTEPRALDGSPLKAYEVEKLASPVFYRTTVGTNVLSAPSVVAQSLSKLEANTKIRVVAKMGQWLELRSSNGNRGFIYAQDAEEVKGQ